MNLKTGKNFSIKTDSTIKFINGRISDGRTIEDFKKIDIIDKCLHKKYKENKINYEYHWKNNK